MTNENTWVGKVLSDRYEIRGELGSGGMAVVYRALDRKLAREVAVKVMRKEVSAALGSDRFLKEIRLLSSLTHSNIVGLIDSGEFEGALYYVMPIITGESLKNRIAREGSLPLEDAISIAVDVARALSHAHAFGIVHRDIKPDNIMLAGGSALVADFGIAKAIGESGSEKLTATGIAIGTVAYMSPEQAHGENVDHRSDQYSLASVLYEMLLGDPPFAGISAQALLARKSTETARPLRSVRETVSPKLEEVVLRALSRHPADRYPTLKDFAEEVTSVPARATADQIAAVTGDGAVARFADVASVAHGRKRFLGVATVPIAVAVVLAIVLGVRKIGPADRTAGTPVRIAFLACNADRDMQPLAEGAINAIVGRLQRVALAVPLTTGAIGRMTAAGDDPTVIADSLDADLISGCSIEDGNLQLTLWDRSGTEIWQGSFDASQPGEEQITLRLLEVMSISPQPEELAAIRSYRSASLIADSLYRLSLNYNPMFNDSLNTVKMELLNKAIEADSTFAPAWAALSVAHTIRYRNLGTLHEPGVERRAAVRTALVATRLNSRIPDSHLALGQTQAWMDFDLEAARASFEAAHSLAPYNPVALVLLAFLAAWTGHPDSAMALVDRSSEVQPLDQLGTLTHGFIYYLAGTYEEAIEDYRWINQIANGDPANGLLIWVLIENGQIPEAREVAARTCTADAPAFPACFGSAFVDAASGDRERVFAWIDQYRQEIEGGVYARIGKTNWHFNDDFAAAELLAMVGEVDSSFVHLEEAYLGGSAYLTRFRVDPHFRNLRHDARFEELALRIGLPALAN
ncbi:MAG: protein kinase [Gammaproteobacteria bacterium]|nr:protein kinase [Gammaproteobacteria bacterium]